MLVITEMQAHSQFFCVIGNERNRALALNGSYGSISFFFTSSYPIFRASAFSSLPCFLGRALGWVSSAWGTLLPVRGRGAIPSIGLVQLRTLKKHYVTHIILMIVQMWFEFTHHFFLFHSVADYVVSKR